MIFVIFSHYYTEMKLIYSLNRQHYVRNKLQLQCFYNSQLIRTIWLFIYIYIYESYLIIYPCLSLFSYNISCPLVIHIMRTLSHDLTTREFRKYQLKLKLEVQIESISHNKRTMITIDDYWLFPIVMIHMNHHSICNSLKSLIWLSLYTKMTQGIKE